MTELAELVLIPCAARGHLAPALEFAKLVVGRDDRLSVTVLITKLPLDHNLAAYADSLVASFSPSQRIKFVLISNDYVPAEGTANPIVYLSLFNESRKLHVKDAVTKMVLDSGSRLAGFVVDMMFATMADVADEFGVPTYFFWTGNAGFLGLKLHLLPVWERGEKAIEDCGRSESLDVPVFVKPVPVPALPAAPFDKASAAAVFDIMVRIRKAKGVVLNTCAEIEPHAVSTLMSSGSQSPPLYPVGPVLNLSDSGSDAFSGCVDGVNIMEWLDRQPPSSVLFLCFGSFGSFSGAQIMEIASALERTGFRFLWTLRNSPPKDKLAFASDVCADPAAVLPEGFLDRTAEVGRIISWAPQAAVLSHRAVGGFVSHCGWNSLLESLWFGVPVAAWPLYAEQQLNAFEMVVELGLAVEIRMDYRAGFDTGTDNDEAMLVSAEEIEAGMRRVMEGECEVRKRVKETSEKCRKAVMEGGSSRTALDCFVSDVFAHFMSSNDVLGSV